MAVNDPHFPIKDVISEDVTWKDTPMTASMTISHFQDMGVLENVVTSTTGQPLAIMASAPDGYAMRCMKDFRTLDGYYISRAGIDAITVDGVPVVMTFI
jgi:hypothetical protein